MFLIAVIVSATIIYYKYLVLKDFQVIEDQQASSLSD